jgi:DNA-binding beta-propeller fold protein YncE
MSKHTVIVWSEPYTIEVYRKYKSVWVASGDYRGTTITVQDQTCP